MSDYKKCPFCDEEIKVIAVKCRYCKSMLIDENHSPDFNKDKNDTIAEKPVYKEKEYMHDEAIKDDKDLSNANATKKKTKTNVVWFILVGLLIVVIIASIIGSNGIEDSLKEGSESLQDFEEAPQEGVLDSYVVVDVPEISFLNLRSGPSSNYSSLDKLKRGTELRVIGGAYEDYNSIGDMWLQIVTPDGKEGWVHSDFVYYSHEGSHGNDLQESHGVISQYYNLESLKTLGASSKEMAIGLLSRTKTDSARAYYYWDTFLDYSGVTEPMMFEAIGEQRIDLIHDQTLVYLVKSEDSIKRSIASEAWRNEAVRMYINSSIEVCWLKIFHIRTLIEYHYTGDNFLLREANDIEQAIYDTHAFLDELYKELEIALR